LDVKMNRRPIYLFADSQLLFWREGGNLFLDSVRRLVWSVAPRAAYIGAPNGDAPEYYSIFEAAMSGAGIYDNRMILRSFPAGDRAFLNEADIILLAGGEVETGWRVLVETGMRELILRRYEEGAVLMGVSAGAVQLGLCGLTEGAASPAQLIETFKLVPFVIDAHDEGRGWGRLRDAIRLLGGAAKGVGIPFGGGMVYHPGGRVEAMRRPLLELSFEGGTVRDALLHPK
jgi:hypothetical protein